MLNKHGCATLWGYNYSFGSDFLQTLQYAWVFAVDWSCKDTEGGLDNCLLSRVWEDELLLLSMCRLSLGFVRFEYNT